MIGVPNVRNRRAMLIGIDTYPHVPQLDGCVNDVRLMRSVLVATFAFALDRITLLTNDQATRDAILSAFDALIAATGTDDIVVIHYAGHGSRMTDREGDEPSGFDSTIMPFDSGRAPHQNRDITDDEIQLKLEALAAKTSYATLIFDACHSGTITRDLFGGKARGVTADRRSVSELPPSPIPGHLRRGTPPAGPSGWMPLADKYVLIAGCRDEEMSYEYRPPEADGAVTHGALTYFLCEHLRQAAPGTSYRDVFERAAARVSAENSAQHPQMEGQADREIFGVADLTPITFVQVTAREGSTVTLGAGAAHGVTVGSTYALFPQRTKTPDGAESIGDIQITGVRVVTAEAQLLGEIADGAVGPGARGYETSHAFGDFRLPVQCVGSDGVDQPFSRLHDRLSMSSLVKVVSEDSVAAARVYLLGARSKVSSAEPVPQAGVLDAPRWAVVGTTGDLLMPLKMLGDESVLVENLETIARYRQALALENPDPDSYLRGRFTLDLLRLEGDGSWSVARPESDGGHIVFDEDEAIGFRIESRHDEPVHISLLDFGLSGVIAQVFPPRSAQDTLAPGIVFEIGTASRTPVRLTWPAGYPFVDAAAHLREAEGSETVKLFVTEQPAAFFALEQHGVRSTASRSPVASLLRGAFHGLATRDIAMSPVGAEDWTTVSRSFVLRRKTSASLPPDGAPVAIGTATLSAPGLSGTAGTGFGKQGREKADRLINGALHRALSASGIETRQTIEIVNAQERGPAHRHIGDRPAFELRVPDPGAGFGQMVIAVDELGVVSWCFAAPGSSLPATRELEGAALVRTYVIPRSVPAEIAAADATRGLVGVLGKKFLVELVFPLLDPLLGAVSETFVNRLEQNRWPYRVRSFTPDDYVLDEASAIDRDGWSRLASGRALLMVHGAFSRTHLAFAQLPKDCVESLNQLYGGRVFAFDHITLSHDPRENVRRFVSAMPEDADLTLDIVAHSRGGLVSRWLSEKQHEISLGSRRLRIGKVVFVGAPSAGTALADPQHVGDVLDVFTNLMNFLPDNGVVDVMTMIVEVAKQVAVGALGGLDGLQSMRPGGDFARQMNAGARSGDTKYFAVASNVTPSDPGLRHFAVSRGLNQLLQGPNDFVVPTQGVFAANGSGFFPIEERLLLEGALGVAHTRYFENVAVRDTILKWLAAPN